jgi:hypothetical protein
MSGALHRSEGIQASQHVKSLTIGGSYGFGVISARFGSFVSPTTPRRQEINLSTAQLLVVTGSVLCSIFLFTWAVTRLWLSGR